jgi:type IV pilus assembly protein PilA
MGLMMNVQTWRSLTLVGLVIVVAIGGILAAIAIPQYQQYVTRARWVNIWTSVAPVQRAVSECAQRHDGAIAAGFCQSVAELMTGGFLPPDFVMPQVEGVWPSYSSGQFDVRSAANVSGLGRCAVTLSAAVVSGAVTWTPTVTGDGCTEESVGLTRA